MAISERFGPPVAVTDPTLTEVAPVPGHVVPAASAPDPSPRSRRTPVIVAVIALLGAMAGMAIAILATGGDDEQAVSPRRAGGTTAPTSDPDDVPTSAPSVAATQTVSGNGFTAELPDDWSVGAPTLQNDGKQVVRLLTGPDGAVIRLVHTPDYRADPGSKYTVSRSGLTTGAAESELILLDDFPTPECERRRCSDLVLNDRAYGGLATLVNGLPGSHRYAVAEALARSVTAG